MTVKPLYALLCSTVLLAACGETVGLQKDYVKMRDTCQQYAEQKVGWLISQTMITNEPKEKNTKLVEEFNSCMTTRGWDIGKPKDAPEHADSGGGIIDTAKVKPGSGSGRSGVGIGVGPLYQLEESGRAAGGAVRSGERGDDKSVVPVPVLVPTPVPVPVNEGTAAPAPAPVVVAPVVTPAPIMAPPPATPAEPTPTSRYDPKTPPPSLSPDEARRVKRILETGEE